MTTSALVAVAAVLALGIADPGSAASAPPASPDAAVAPTHPASRAACTDRATTETIDTTTAPVITLATVETYPGPTVVRGFEYSDPALSRTLRARVLRAPGSVLAPEDLFASVMAAYRAEGGSQRFRAQTGRTTDEQESISVAGTQRFRRSGSVVWYRGYRTLSGTFRYTACVDGADVQRTGSFSSYGAGRSGAQPCRRVTPPNPVARAARARYCR